MALNDSFNLSINKTEILNTAVDASKDKLLELISPFIWVIQAIGVLLLLYIIFLLVRAFMKFQDHLRIKRIESKVDLILSKLDKKDKVTTTIKKEKNSKKN